METQLGNGKTCFYCKHPQDGHEWDEAKNAYVGACRMTVNGLPMMRQRPGGSAGVNADLVVSFLRRGAFSAPYVEAPPCPCTSFQPEGSNVVPLTDKQIADLIVSKGDFPVVDEYFRKLVNSAVKEHDVTKQIQILQQYSVTRPECISISGWFKGALDTAIALNRLATHTEPPVPNLRRGNLSDEDAYEIVKIIDGEEVDSRNQSRAILQRLNPDTAIGKSTKSTRSLLSKPIKRFIAKLITNNSKISTKDVCKEIDKKVDHYPSYEPKQWGFRFWTEAYENMRMKPRVESYVSKIRHDCRSKLTTTYQ